MSRSQPALDWVARNATRLRRRKWRLLVGAIRCPVDEGDWGARLGCPMSALAPDGPERVGTVERMADLHDLPDDVACDIAEAADGHDSAPHEVRQALLAATGLTEDREAPA